MECGGCWTRYSYGPTQLCNVNNNDKKIHSTPASLLMRTIFRETPLSCMFYRPRYWRNSRNERQFHSAYSGNTPLRACLRSSRHSCILNAKEMDEHIQTVVKKTFESAWESIALFAYSGSRCHSPLAQCLDAFIVFHIPLPHVRHSPSANAEIQR